MPETRTTHHRFRDEVVKVSGIIALFDGGDEMTRGDLARNLKCAPSDLDQQIDNLTRLRIIRKSSKIAGWQRYKKVGR